MQLLEQVLLAQLAGLESRDGIRDGNHLGDVLVGGLTVQLITTCGDYSQLIGRELILDPGVEYVISHAPLVVASSLDEDAVLRTLELVPAADNRRLQVLPATLVDVRVGLLECRDELTATERRRGVGGIAVLVDVPCGHGTNQHLLHCLELAFGDLGRNATLVEAGGEGDDRGAVQRRQTLFVPFALVARREDVAGDDQRDQADHQDGGQHDHERLVLIEPFH